MPNNINGVTGADNIIELWMGHFGQLFNCIHDNDITSLHYDVTYTNDIFVTVGEIIGILDNNKPCGLPDSMLSVMLVPVIKEKCGKINDSDNYRRIALANVMSKIVKKSYWVVCHPF